MDSNNTSESDEQGSGVTVPFIISMLSTLAIIALIFAQYNDHTKTRAELIKRQDAMTAELQQLRGAMVAFAHNEGLMVTNINYLVVALRNDYAMMAKMWNDRTNTSPNRYE